MSSVPCQNFPLYLQTIEARRQQLLLQQALQQDEVGPMSSHISEQNSVLSSSSTLLPPVIPISSSPASPPASHSLLPRSGSPSGQLTETDSYNDDSSTGSNRTPGYPLDGGVDVMAQLRDSPGRAPPSTLRKDFHGLTRRGLWPTLSPKSTHSTSPRTSPRRPKHAAKGGSSATTTTTTTSTAPPPPVSLVCTGASPRHPWRDHESWHDGSAEESLGMGHPGDDEAVITVSVLPTAEVQHSYCTEAVGDEVKVSISSSTGLEAFREVVWSSICAKRSAVREGAFTLHAYLPTSHRIVRLAHEAMWCVRVDTPLSQRSSNAAC